MSISTAFFRSRTFTALVVTFLLIAVLMHLSQSSGRRMFSILPERPQSTTRKNIAVASLFGAHFDVYMAVVWTLGRIMKEGSVQVYSSGPFRFDFQTVVESCGLFDGALKDQGDFLKDMREDESIDLVVLGTCEIDLKKEWSEPLLKIWDDRDASHKFKIVCIVHNIRDDGWHENIPHWSRRNAIRLLPISPHVGNSFREKFLQLSRDPNPVLRSAGYEYIPIDAHIPLLDIPNIPSPPRRALSNVVIQGSFERIRRDYTNVFTELVQSVSAEPHMWGYRRVGDDTTVVEDESLGQPFKLHLVGSGSIEVPKELGNIVMFHKDLSYPDFYRLMGGMDICVPAFAVSQYIDYYKYQASSTIAMCTEVNLPILAVRALREAYTYIDDDAVTITRPAVMSEVEAIKALRSGNTSVFLQSDPSSSGVPIGSHPQVREDLERMMSQGWMRTKQGFDACKRRTWSGNERVMNSIIHWT